MENSRLPGESALAFTYYELYRALPPAERLLRVLTEQEVNGKKRSRAMLAKWSTKHNWQERIKVYDNQGARDAYVKMAKRRQTDITNFIDEDMEIALIFQKLCKSSLKKLEQSGGKLELKELRQLALAYKESREWLRELVGFPPEEEEDDGEEAGEG